MPVSEILLRPEISSRVEPAARPLPEHLGEALALLLQAHDYACELEQDDWDLAVELDVLRGARLTNSDLRLLVAKGYIDHAIEVTASDDVVRRFRRPPLLSLHEAACFVLTPSGVALARETAGNSSVAGTANDGASVSICDVGSMMKLDFRPKWDEQRRQLRVGSQVVKEFKLPSRNQETVLVAFEEEGWPPRIDDPLPPVAHLDSRRRLHDTIKALNRKQKHALIRFRGDGSGEGIRWEPIDA